MPVRRRHDFICSVRQRAEFEISYRIGEYLVDDSACVEFQHYAKTLFRRTAGGHENFAANGVRGAAPWTVGIVRPPLRKRLRGACRESNEQRKSLWKGPVEKSGAPCHNSPPGGNGEFKRDGQGENHLSFSILHLSFAIAGVDLINGKWQMTNV